ncbi:unnamed protein product [Closterium sp. Naga37s-1]|nr:unnamed protein product [Closterium sp. Naga37s-1]
MHLTPAPPLSSSPPTPPYSPPFPPLLTLPIHITNPLPSLSPNVTNPTPKFIPPLVCASFHLNIPPPIPPLPSPPHPSPYLPLPFPLPSLLASDSQTTLRSWVHISKIPGWVHISKIPGYKAPYPLNCSKHFSCANVPPGKQHPSNYLGAHFQNTRFEKVKFKKVKFKKVTVGNWRLGSYFVPNYNLTTPFHSSPPFLQKFKKVPHHSLRPSRSSPHQFKKVTVGNRRLGSYFVPNYNLTTLTINSGYLTANHKTAVYTMNPKWATLLPYTDAIVFNAGHWFFHPPQNQSEPWYPIPVMSKALVTVRDYFAKANYKGAAVFFTFSPVHDKGYCNAAQPFPTNVQADNTLMTGVQVGGCW